MKKLVIGSIAAIISVGVIAGNVEQKSIDRATFATTLFTGVEQYENFSRLVDFFPVTKMNASTKPFNFKEGAAVDLPHAYVYKGKNVDVESFLTETDTSALLVIKNGEVRFERYMLTGGRDVNWLSMSVAKSFIATGIGIAVDDGLIDIEKPITDYVPSLTGSAYDAVRIKDVLQMSSGAAWNEDYSDPSSDVMRLGQIMAVGGSLDDFVPTLKREKEPGTLNHYNSTDTQALGMLLARATGQTVTHYMAEKIWQPLGMESDAFWLVDDNNVEMAFAGLNATARDYAKLGELHRLKGRWQGRQIVSEQWVRDATRPDAPHLMPGLDENFPLGYGYQWWIPASTDGEYSAIGVYNQFIYVNPAKDLVIVKLSANSNYASSLDESAYREVETIEFFREIAKVL
jgi:CubicO group peptidase (beta-lactamase class C family)